MIKKIFIGLILLLVFLMIGVAGYIFFTQERETLTEETRGKLEGSFIKLSNGSVHYELKGPVNGKSVILIHGAGSGYYAWDNNFQYLADQGFRVLRFDLYGRGFSDRPEATYDSVFFYNQLQELLDSVKLKPPYAVSAVSMGTSIALHFTQKNLHEVTHLILTDPASLSDGKLPWYLKNKIIGTLLMSLYWYPRAVEKQMHEYYDPSAVPEYREKSWQQLKYKGLKSAMLSTWQNSLTLNMTNAMERIGQTSVKVLLVWGKEDPLIHVDVSKHYLEAMPRAKLVVIEKAGHLSNYEKPAIFNAAINKFLKNEE